MRAAALCVAAAAGGAAAALPAKDLGMYILIADDTDKRGYTSTKDWTPQLYPYQQTGSNLLYLTFINPARMPAVPPAYAALAKGRGGGGNGSVPSGTTIMFAIGGQAYSQNPNPWEWLTSREKAEAMAAEVAKWPAQHGCDGVDLDIETGAGDAAAAPNLVFFVAKLRELSPQMIVTQPVFGSPTSVPAANAVIEAAYNKSAPGAPHGAALGSVARVGIMVYGGTSSETYLENYVEGCSKHCTQWYCPLAACVPKTDMLLGADGSSGASTQMQLANDVKSMGLGGVMVWYASVLDSATGGPALQYGPQMDASGGGADARAGWAQALAAMG